MRAFIFRNQKNGFWKSAKVRTLSSLIPRQGLFYKFQAIMISCKDEWKVRAQMWDVDLGNRRSENLQLYALVTKNWWVHPLQWGPCNNYKFQMIIIIATAVWDCNTTSSLKIYGLFCNFIS